MITPAWSADQQAAQIFPAPAAQQAESPFPRKMLLVRRAVRQQHHHQVLSSLRACCVLQPGGPAASRGSRFFGRFREVQHAATGQCARHSSHAATGGSFRAFGGQSVVPWELALFLVEEMKAELVQPGAVVYTAALAECRWAGEQGHVDYLLQEMKAEGLRIVPGIPGATDDELPPSQAPPLFGKLPEKAPSGARRTPPPDPPAGATTAATSQRSSAVATGTTAVDEGAISALQAAARTADAALATVETMWAREEHEPSAATCRAALDACAAGGQWERALSLVRDAAMVMAADADADVGYEGVDTQADRGVSGEVEALAVEGRWSEALVLVQKDAAP